MKEYKSAGKSNYKMVSYRCFLLYLILVVSFSNCRQLAVEKPKEETLLIDVLNYSGIPSHAFDKDMLMYSDQGAWFAYSIPDTITDYAGFSGPFMLTQQSGVWSSPCLSSLQLLDKDQQPMVWTSRQNSSYTSHLEQTLKNNEVSIHQKLYFGTGHTALTQSIITNTSPKSLILSPQWTNKKILADGWLLSSGEFSVKINSSKSDATGYILFPEETTVSSTDSTYLATASDVHLEPGQSKEFITSETFIFPEYSWKDEKSAILENNFEHSIKSQQEEKRQQISSLNKERRPEFSEEVYENVLTKAQLTLQNNWRIAAGELKHEGLFPSYHYKWFNGFWSWDSWKHAVGLSYYAPQLAKNQMRAMFDFQSENGFIVDCVYRDTTIEAHNYRDTKPPLAAWAVAKIYQKDSDIDFVREFYPKLRKYHDWWYKDRDHDQDSLCEYGSTDGSLIAAKWESGMDNAIRFDDSKILRNSESAYSLDQESVDLNSYLYAEKLYLAELAEVLQEHGDVILFRNQAKQLKKRIQEQFYDENDGWFYDTNLSGDQFIKGEGSEGWTSLWAKAASEEQAESVKNRMMDRNKFYTTVPFQTMNADHPKFDPLKGYWRGPNWLDQAYFGVRGLRNYGFDEEADKATIKLLHGAEGLLDKGPSIRENYHPLTGEGLHAQNFSWSAAHIIMLLMQD